MQAKNPISEIPVRYIKGVGPQKAELFKRVGVETILDLFYYLPRRYEDRTRIVEIKDLKPGHTQAVIGKVLKVNLFTARTGAVICEMQLGDEKNRVFAVWYNQPYMKKVFSIGDKVVLYGKCELTTHLQITHPAFDIITDKRNAESLEIGRIVPFYPLTENLTQKYLRKIVNEAIKTYAPKVKETIPTQIRARKKLVDAEFAARNIHFPFSFDNLERAYKRLVFEEFLILQTVMALKRKNKRKSGIKHEVKRSLLSSFEELFKFDLTKNQKKCIKDIELDMSSGKAMYRLLQGDVGSGKTVVAMYALLLTCTNGYQGILMVPTEVLARQHFVTISKTFMPLGFNVRLLVSGMDQMDKAQVKKEMAQGEADIIIGTHALIQEEVQCNDLGMVIIDEQHKFGVQQRKKLMQKGRMPDTLVMTATPIPRSLVMTVFGDMDISILREKPLERQPVTTYVFNEDQRSKVYQFIADEVGKKRQAFIVCPRVKETERSDLKSAEAQYEHLSKEIFPEFKVSLIHGKMKSDEKKRIMEDFQKGKTDILVATTVIEVGVDIPNVTIMMVEHAERYGLSQLHQLRGRIGRGKYPSYCILIGETKTDSSFERLTAISDTDDGFTIAEKDMDIRGPGEFLGTRQSGLPELKVGNIAKDFSIMQEAREEAFSIVASDPHLVDKKHNALKESITERFKGKVKI